MQLFRIWARQTLELQIHHQNWTCPNWPVRTILWKTQSYVQPKGFVSFITRSCLSLESSRLPLRERCYLHTRHILGRQTCTPWEASQAITLWAAAGWKEGRNGARSWSSDLPTHHFQWPKLYEKKMPAEGSANTRSPPKCPDLATRGGKSCARRGIHRHGSLSARCWDMHAPGPAPLLFPPREESTTVTKSTHRYIF